MRLVGVDGARLRGEVVGEREARVPRRNEHVAKDAVTLELEPIRHGRDALDARQPHALVPGGLRAQLVDVVQNSATVG